MGLRRKPFIIHYIMRSLYSKYLRAFYEKLKAKKGSGKAIIATAKKLLGIIYNTLKNIGVFEDFPYYVI